MILVALALQAVTTASAAPPAKFSILYDPCAAAHGKDVVVCGKDSATSERLPLPDDAPPTPNYVKPDSGDYRDNDGGGGSSCAAQMGGCQVGFGPPIVPMIAAAVKAVGDARKEHRWAKARARDGARRQPINLDASAPAGRLEP